MILATIAALAATLAIELPGQTRWELRRPTVAPSPRGRSAAVFVPTQEKVLLFGGWGPNSTVFGDTWQWDGDAWDELSPASSPSARGDPGLAYDVARDRVVLFGGANPATSVFDDTWEWDGSGWIERTPSVSPSRRSGHAMVYDPIRGTVLLHGGMAGADVLGDMWEWDGTTWTRMDPPIMPSARAFHCMVWDATRERVVLYGGMAPWGVYYFEETWEWDGNSWSLRSTSSLPGSQTSFGMAFDTRRGLVVLQAGDSTFVRGEAWAPSLPSVTPNVERVGTLVTAPHGRILLFGGSASAQITNATWVLVEAPPSGSWDTFGEGCGASALHPVLTNIGQPPQLGSPLRVRVSDLPTDRSALMVLGTSRTSAQGLTLPFDLGAVGMPGCWLYVSPDVVMPLFVQGGVADWAIMVPPDARLFGQSFFQQAFGIDRAANALGMVTSNAAEGRIGSP